MEEQNTPVEGLEAAEGQEGQKELQPMDLINRIIQIGVVVDDLDKAIEGMRKVLGAEPRFVKLMDYPWVRYRGKEVPGKARIASYSLGIEVELMEPVGEGDLAWKDHLANAPRVAGYALHHIRFNDVEDNDQLSEVLAKRGIEVYMEGGSVVNPGGRFTYYDTREDLGFVIEAVTKVAR